MAPSAAPPPSGDKAPDSPPLSSLEGEWTAQSPNWQNVGELDPQQRATLTSLIRSTALMLPWREVERDACSLVPGTQSDCGTVSCEGQLVPARCGTSCGCAEPPHGEALDVSSYSLIETRKLCDSEPYAYEPSVGSCAAFLVSDRLMVTAGHCVDTPEQCRETAFLFDYTMEDATQPGLATARNGDELYYCRRVLMRDNNAAPDNPLGPDFALIELDRSVRDREPLPLGEARATSELVSAGFPYGLPLKLMLGQNMGSLSNSHLATSHRLTSGFSGGPLFDPLTGVVVGVNSRVDQPSHKLSIVEPLDGSCGRFGVDAECGIDRACPAQIQRAAALQPILAAWRQGQVQVVSYESTSPIMEVDVPGSVLVATAYVEFADNGWLGHAQVEHNGIRDELYHAAVNAMRSEMPIADEPHHTFHSLRRSRSFGTAAGSWRVDPLGRPLARWRLTLLTLH